MKVDLAIDLKKQIVHHWRGYVTRHKLVAHRRYAILGGHLSITPALCTLIYLTSVMRP